MSVGPWIDAKVNQPPLDGKPRLLMVRFHPDVPTVSPVVGIFRELSWQWRLSTNDLGQELFVDYWMEIPELPG
jgi:hypothetical protein